MHQGQKYFGVRETVARATAAAVRRQALSEAARTCSVETFGHRDGVESPQIIHPAPQSISARPLGGLGSPESIR